LGRMIHGAVIRTFAQQDVVEFAEYGKIPTINALTDDEHPCQILTDIFTFGEKTRKTSDVPIEEIIRGKVITFVGDAACNVPISWIFAAARMGFELRLAAPSAYLPSKEIMDRAEKMKVPGAKFVLTEDLKSAVAGADMLYTDVWVSMGKEAESAQRLLDLKDYQVNSDLVALAKPSALVMHCLPAYRGKEISEECFEKHAITIFDQAENRLHTQKAILSLLK